MASNIVNGGSTPINALHGDEPSEAVQYVPQTLSSTQQTQARENIGVAGASEVAYLGTVVGRT